MINRRYLIKKKLGQGRSAVYLCEDSEQVGRNYAIKILSPEASDEEKILFRNEFQTIQKFDHPNIIQAYERGTVAEISENEPISVGSKYLLMEYFDGNELTSYQITDESKLIQIITQICSVLFYLHQSKYIYYDLKLENILLSEENGSPLIKLIDFGFARSYSENESGVTGTAEYIAPELLKKDSHDHRVDLYALGILLYRLIYGDFPFQSQDQLEIYREHIQGDFYFPATNYSSNLIDVVKKLVSKNPDDRYFTSVQVLIDLNIPLTEEIYRDWIPIKVFSNRTDILNIVNRHLNSPASGEIIIIRGYEGAGKTAVTREIYARYENIVHLTNDRTKTGFGLVRLFLNKLIFNEFIFNRLNPELLQLLGNIIKGVSENLTNDLKLAVNKISSLYRFTLLLDDFNLYDNFALEIFKEIFPILQINGCDIILTEKSDLDYVTGFINNSIKLDLIPFTSTQVDELLDKTYANFFPVEEVRQLVVHHADFLPGNLIEFLRNLVLLRIIRFEYDDVKVVSDENAEKILVNIYEEIYNIRFNSLNVDELKIALLLSSFEVTPDYEMLIKLTHNSKDNFLRIVENLKRKHILQSQVQTGLNFTSDGIKNFIYSKVPNKQENHEAIAKTINKNFPHFSKLELARHYEMSENYEESYAILMSEAEEAERISAFSYEQSILEKLIKFPLSEDKKFRTKYKLCTLYNLLNIYKNSYELTEELLSGKLSENEKRELLIIKGNSLIKLGEAEKGKKILNDLLPSIGEDKRKLKLMLDVAWGELETNNFDVAAEIGNKVIKNTSALAEYKGDSYNLLGLIDIHKNNDLRSALVKFQKCLEEYSSVYLIHRIAGIEINIGNIYNILGDFEKVETHWNKSLEISSSQGNLNYQAQVLMNFGIFHFKNQSFENSVNNYKRASLIFQTIGDKIGQGRSDVNLGEVYLFICEYKNAVDSLTSAKNIFHGLQNYLEESETCFLLAKTYAIIGDEYYFNKTLEEMNSLLEKFDLPDRIRNHINFLMNFRAHDLNITVNIEDLLIAANDYLLQEENLNYFDAATLLIKRFISLKETEKAYEILSDKNYTEICSSNPYLSIEKELLMGKVALLNQGLFTESPIVYFNKAFDLMNDLNVNETSCRIILELSEYYFERGNISKARELAYYGKSLLNFLGSQFDDERSKDLYLNSSYRKDAWERFAQIINTP